MRSSTSEHDEVRLSFVHRGVGGITETDVILAVVSNAIIIGFNVRPDRKARELAEHGGVEIRLYEVIYNVLEDVQQRARRHAQARVSKRWSRARPRSAKCSASRASARSPVASSRTARSPRGSQVRFLREGTVIWKGRIASLRRFKDDVREVREGFECGVGLENYYDLKPGDVIETFEEREIARV